MSLPLRICMIVFVLLSSLSSIADSWVDPGWQYMIDSSDVVALIKYRSKGEFGAYAEVITLYKGRLQPGNEIWISGYSNRYGPHDVVHKNDQYLVFLHFRDPNPEDLAYYKEQDDKRPHFKHFLKAFEEGKAYRVWSPTAGDLKVRGKEVQYDLIQTTFYTNQKFLSLPLFEEFLQARYDVSKRETASWTINVLLKTVKTDYERSQCLLMLHYLGYSKYDPLYADFLSSEDPSVRYGLTKLMGNMNDPEARRLLVSLLDDKHSIVQGEAVRQLKSQPAGFVGPILTAHLITASEMNHGPSNLMDPVMNTISGGKKEMIRVLGELKYKPAADTLVRLLDTDNDDVFEDVIDALRAMESRAYIPSLKKYLLKKRTPLIYSICRTIVDDSLTECLPELKQFISTCNRNRVSRYLEFDYAITTCCGLAHFNDSSTASFLENDLKKFFTYMDTVESKQQSRWMKTYVKTFAELKDAHARPLLQEVIFDWSGYNSDFGLYPRLFDLKQTHEDSIAKVFDLAFGKKEYSIEHCIAFIENTKGVIKGEAPEVRYMIQVRGPSTKEAETEKAVIASELHMPAKDIYIRDAGGTYYSTIQERFDDDRDPLYEYISYADSIPDKTDLQFLKALIDHKVFRSGYQQSNIEETIRSIGARLKEE